MFIWSLCSQHGEGVENFFKIKCCRVKDFSVDLGVFPVGKSYILVTVPFAQDASHHQDFLFFLIGHPKLNLHLPLLRGGGTTQNM